MIPGIVFDPSVFWICDEHENQEKLCTLLSSIVEWLSVGVSGARVFVDAAATDALFLSGKIPFGPRLEVMLEIAGLTEVITASELASLLNRTLASAETLDVLGARAVIIDDIELSGSVALIDDEQVASISRETLLLVAFVVAKAQADLRYVSPHAALAGTVDVVGVAIEAEPPGLLTAGEERISCTVHIVRRVRDYALSLDCIALWKERSRPSVALAISSLAYQSVEYEIAIDRFVIGAEFIKSVELNQGFSDAFCSVVLMKCAAVVARLGTANVGEFREAAALGSGARLRPSDGARAQRVHVTNGNPAVRLMFWRLTDGSIEFANIGPKKELYIAT